MKTIKSLVLGSAAGLLAMGGAQAADLPVKAKAVEYVKVCSLYGAGFFYIPGTDTCIKLGGYLRLDTSFSAAGVQDQPAWNGDPGQMNRYRDYFSTRSRLALTVDTLVPSRPEVNGNIRIGSVCSEAGDRLRVQRPGHRVLQRSRSA
jgi:hypothetical protein